MIAYIERHREARRHAGDHPRLAAQPPLEREDSFSVRARRHRVHPGHRLEGGGRRREVQARRSSFAGDGAGRARHRPRRQPGARRVRAGRLGFRDRERLDRLPDHSERARRRLPARPPPSVDSLRAPAGHPARAARGRSARSAISSTIRASSSPTRRSSRPRRARERRRCFRSTTSRIRKSS